MRQLIFRLYLLSFSFLNQVNGITYESPDRINQVMENRGVNSDSFIINQLEMRE